MDKGEWSLTDLSEVPTHNEWRSAYQHIPREKLEEALHFVNRYTLARDCGTLRYTTKKILFGEINVY